MPGGTGSIVERLEPADDAGGDPGLSEWPGRVPTLFHEPTKVADLRVCT